MQPLCHLIDRLHAQASLQTASPKRTTSPLCSRSLYDDVDLGSTCSFSSESDDFRFNMNLDLDVHLEKEAKYSMICPSGSLQAPTPTWKLTSPTNLKNSDHALLCSPPPVMLNVLNDRLDSRGTWAMWSFHQVEVVLQGDGKGGVRTPRCFKC